MKTFPYHVGKERYRRLEQLKPNNYKYIDGPTVERLHFQGEIGGYLVVGEFLGSSFRY